MIRIELSSFHLDDILIVRCYREVEIESPLNLPTDKAGKSGKVVKMKALVPKRNRCKEKWKLRETKKTGRNIGKGFLHIVSFDRSSFSDDAVVRSGGHFLNYHY